MLRHCHKTASAKSTCCRKRARMGVNASLTGCHKKCRMRQSDRGCATLTRGAPSRVDHTKGRLATWDPGGRPPGEKIFNSKRPVEANENNAVGIDARNKTKHTWQHQSRVSQATPP